MYVGTQTAGPSNSQTETQGTAFNVEDGTQKTPNGVEVASATKSVGFKNTYSTHDLTFNKTVEGNQGSKDKYFKFTVDISNAVAGTKYDVDLTNADASVPSTNLNSATDSSYAGNNNPTTITVGTEGTITQDFYLQHGQSITIKGIADGTAYTITEAQEDYTPSAVVTGDDEGITNSDNSVADTALKADTDVAFTNNRKGVIPTGILVSIAPVAIIGLIVIGGIVFLIVKNKRRESEED